MKATAALSLAAILPAAALAADAAPAATSYFDVPAGGALASLVTAAVAALGTWAAMRHGRAASADSGERLAAAEARADELAKRVTALEDNQQKISATIISENNKIYDRMNSVAQAVYTLQGTVEAFIKVLARKEDPSK